MRIPHLDIDSHVFSEVMMDILGEREETGTVHFSSNYPDMQHPRGSETKICEQGKSVPAPEASIPAALGVLPVKTAALLVTDDNVS